MQDATRQNIILGLIIDDNINTISQSKINNLNQFLLYFGLILFFIRKNQYNIIYIFIKKKSIKNKIIIFIFKYQITVHK